MRDSTTEIQTMIEISKNIVSPSVKLFEKRTHVKRAGSVFYVHKCSNMVASRSIHPFCTDVPVLVDGENFSPIR